MSKPFSILRAQGWRGVKGRRKPPGRDGFMIGTAGEKKIFRSFYLAKNFSMKISPLRKRREKFSRKN